MNWKVALLLLAVIGVGVWGWYLQREHPSNVQSVALGAPPPQPRQPDVQPLRREEAPGVPAAPARKPSVGAPFELDHSDGQVRAAVADFAAKFAQWLTPEEQMRKWVVLVDQMADGKLPEKNRPLAYPMAKFAAQKQDDRMLLDESNYARADALVDVFTAIPIEPLVAYYHAWRPLLDKAYAEIGGRGGFDKRLRAAMNNVEAVHSLTAQPELVQPVVYYKYSDETLEKASDVEKLMWRLGPKNTQKVQDYLHRLEPAL